LKYAQSSPVVTSSDSSVSYASAVVTLDGGQGAAE